MKLYLLFLKYGLFTMTDCDMAKTESPTLRKPSTTERIVGSVIAAVSGLEKVQRQVEYDIGKGRHSPEPGRTLDSCKNGGDKDRICGVVN